MVQGDDKERKTNEERRALAEIAKMLQKREGRFRVVAEQESVLLSAIARETLELLRAKESVSLPDIIAAFKEKKEDAEATSKAKEQNFSWHVADVAITYLQRLLPENP